MTICSTQKMIADPNHWRPIRTRNTRNNRPPPRHGLGNSDDPSHSPDACHMSPPQRQTENCLKYVSSNYGPMSETNVQEITSSESQLHRHHHNTAIQDSEAPSERRFDADCPSDLHFAEQSQEMLCGTAAGGRQTDGGTVLGTTINSLPIQ